MFPTLFDSSWIGLEGHLHFTISSYFFAIFAGFLVAALLAKRDARALGLNGQQFNDFAIWMLIVGLLGGRLFHVLFDGFLWDYIHICTDPFLLEGKSLSNGELCLSNAQCYNEQLDGRDIGAICHGADGLCYPQRDCFRWLKFWGGGLTVYGSIIACVLFSRYYLKRLQWPVAKIMDMGGYGIPLGIAIGRLGCFLAGCCYGGICDIDWLAVQFPVGSLAYQHHYEHFYDALTVQWQAGMKASLPVYPTQILSSLYAFGIFLVAYFGIRPRKSFDGQVILVTAFLYAALRFIVEFWRDDMRGGLMSLSTSQWISFAVIVVSIGLWRHLSRAADNRNE